MLGLIAAIPGVGPAYTLAAGAVSFLLRCTPCLIAIAICVAWIAGDIHGHHKANAVWSAKWTAAEVQAELDRKKRDAFAKAKIEADANNRIAGVAARADELETKVQKYENDEAIRRATGGVAGAAITCDDTDRADDDWLRSLQHRKPKPAARRGLAERLRTGFGRSSDPGKSGR